MKYFAVSLLTLIVAGAAPAADPAGKGLAVHEWGVFRVSEDVDFANGALRAAQWVVKQKPGLYDMQDVLGLR